jgi:hypothetical protein
MTDPTKVALIQSLTSQRQHVLGALEGLDATQLRRAVLPSGWSCLGLVQHLALDVERFWFPMVMAGAPVEDRWEATMDAAWTVDPALSPELVIGLYRDEILRAETATHAGHLDAARELLDGRRWMVLD